MSDNASPVIAHIGPGLIEVGPGIIIPLSQIPLPIIYFEHVPSLSHMNGIIGVTLAVGANVPMGGDKVAPCASVAAFLKCNIPAAIALRAALDSALLLAQPVEKPEGKAN
jgi:hypothetical protein